MKPIDAIIFDMDGLLVDTERVYRDGWIKALEKNDIAIEDTIVSSWVGKSLHETGAYLLKECKSQELLEKIRADREAYIYECLHNGALQAKPFAKEVLKTAKEKGYVTGLATSTGEVRSKIILQYLGLFDDIDYPVFGTDVEQLKPFPDIYLEVLHKMKRGYQQAIAVEDSMTGAKAAQKAKLATILVPDTNFDEDQELLDTIFIKGKDLSIVLQWMNHV